VTSTTRDSYSAAEAVAGLCATLAIFLGALMLFYRPFRLAPVALVLAILATAMSKRQSPLIPFAWASIGIGFVVGATLQILTHHPLY
jgi:apolipoprotein N-acyltransferase